MKKFLLMIILLSTLAGCGNPSAAIEKMSIPNSQTTSTEIAVTNWSEIEGAASTFSDEPSKTEKRKLKLLQQRAKKGIQLRIKLIRP